MKVKCINIGKPNQESEYEALTLGKEYIVLAMEFYDSNSSFSLAIGDFVVYRLRDDDGLVLPYPARVFETVSNILPSCWVFIKVDDELYSILPNRWTREYFWDDYYNDDKDVLDIFRNVEKEILSES